MTTQSPVRNNMSAQTNCITANPMLQTENVGLKKYVWYTDKHVIKVSSSVTTEVTRAVLKAMQF